MGEDWIRKTQKSYKRSIQKAIENRLLPKPLLVSDEQASASYPCAVSASLVPAPGTRLLLHEADTGKLAILHEHQVVGAVNGDAGKDLHEVFEKNPDLCGILEVEVIEADPATQHLEFAIARKNAKSKRKAG